MSLEERIKYWKNEPDESPYRRIYDEHTMDFNDFLVKHYPDNKYFVWSRWNKWISWIAKAYEHDEMELLRNKSGYYRKDTISQDYIDALSLLELGIKLPDDITKVIAFLVVDGFFKHYSIEPVSWININNYTNPNKDSGNFKIIDLAQNDIMLNYLRESLMHLSWWDITRGDPQGR
jgi:hypothetical protein